jgi:hypothetical protein
MQQTTYGPKTYKINLLANQSTERRIPKGKIARDETGNPNDNEDDGDTIVTNALYLRVRLLPTKSISSASKSGRVGISRCTVQYSTVQYCPTPTDGSSASGYPRTVDGTNLSLPFQRKSELVFPQNEQTNERTKNATQLCCRRYYGTERVNTDEMADNITNY